MWRLALAGAITAAAAAGPAHGQVPALPGEAGYNASAWVNAHGRGLDQAQHPDYQLRMLPAYQAGATGAPGWERLFFTDPYVAQDGPERADWLDVEFRNRYGARMTATMIAPRHGKRRPAIVLEPGGYGPRWGLLNNAQGLAESGYVVLTIAPQGDADADRLPADPHPSTPENERCRPHDFGNWQAGEGGVTEDGECAGVQPPVAPGALEDFVIASATDATEIPGLDEAYRAVRARKAFGVLDAVRWLRSRENPWRKRVRLGRIGVAGHSFGAQGALVAGQIDTRRDIDAVVAWDGFGPLDDVAPRVPTMIQHSESRLVGPHKRTPEPDELPGARVQSAFRAAGVPSMLVTLAESTHQEWNYLPYLGVTVGALALSGDVLAAEGAAASRLGERVGLFYTLAWFDRWLKPRKREDARARLLTRQFDDSVDRVAIGQGTWDPVARVNVPYEIAGRSTSQHISPRFMSRADFDGFSCDLPSEC